MAIRVPLVSSIGKQVSSKEKKEEPKQDTKISNHRSLLALIPSAAILSSLLLISGNDVDNSTPSQKDNSMQDWMNNDLRTIPQFSNLEAESIADELRGLNGFEARERFLNSELQRLNPQLLPSNNPYPTTGLDIFNQGNNLSLVCLGVKKYPTEFIFIDQNYFLGKNQNPVRIALSYDEVMNTRSREDVAGLLERKFTQHKEELKEQYLTWMQPYRYDFPRQNGASMVALVLGNLPGMESDMARAVDMYHNQYGMSIEAMCIDGPHKEIFERELRKYGISNFPRIETATRSDILTNFERALKKAIDEKKSTFMFHYGAHGSNDGRIWASDTSFTGEDLAKVLSMNYKGKPICEQIDITIWAGSCYSGRQLDGIKKYFDERKNIPVMSLRILTESTYTTAGASTTPDNASLIIDVMTDNSGPLDYYNSWYREYITYLQSKNNTGVEYANTYIHRMKFADLMARFDTWNRQDPQGYFYSNNPSNHTSEGIYFTSFTPKSTIKNNENAVLASSLNNFNSIHGMNSRERKEFLESFLTAASKA